HLAAARAHAPPRARVEGGRRRLRGGRTGDTPRPAAPTGRVRRQAAARRRAVRRVPPESAAGPPRRRVLELRDLPVPVVGRRARDAADGGNGVRRSGGDLRQRRLSRLRARRRDRARRAPARHRRPRRQARAPRRGRVAPRAARRRGHAVRHDGVQLGPRRAPAGRDLRLMQTLPTVDAPCTLCGGDRAERVWTTADRAFAVPGLHTVVRCRECGFLYQRPRVRDAHLAACYPDHYPRHQEPSPRVPFTGRPARVRAVRWALATGLGYARLRDAHAGLLTRLRARRLLRRLRWSCPPWRGTGRYLDVGCGSGASHSSMCRTTATGSGTCSSTWNAVTTSKLARSKGAERTSPT